MATQTRRKRGKSLIPEGLDEGAWLIAKGIIRDEVKKLGSNTSWNHVSPKNQIACVDAALDQYKALRRTRPPTKPFLHYAAQYFRKRNRCMNRQLTPTGPSATTDGEQSSNDKENLDNEEHSEMEDKEEEKEKEKEEKKKEKNEKEKEKRKKEKKEKKEKEEEKKKAKAKKATEAEKEKDKDKDKVKEKTKDKEKEKKKEKEKTKEKEKENTKEKKKEKEKENKEKNNEAISVKIVRQTQKRHREDKTADKPSKMTKITAESIQVGAFIMAKNRKNGVKSLPAIVKAVDNDYITIIFLDHDTDRIYKQGRSFACNLQFVTGVIPGKVTKSGEGPQVNYEFSEESVKFLKS